MTICCCDRRVSHQTTVVDPQLGAQDTLLVGQVALEVEAGRGIFGGFVGVNSYAPVLQVVRVMVAAKTTGKVFVACPGMYQGAVHANVLAQKPFAMGLNWQRLVQEFDDCLMCNRALLQVGTVESLGWWYVRSLSGPCSHSLP